MKLFYVKGTCALIPRIVINELNLDVEFVHVNKSDKKTSSGEDYFGINPKGSVPALQLENGEVLTESAIISQYLADFAKNTKLLPEFGNFKRYRVLEMVNYLATDLHKSCSPLFNPDVPSDVKDNVFKPVIKKRLEFIDKLLSKNAYITGSDFTIADAYLFVVLSWMGYLKIDISTLNGITNFIKTTQTRPSIVKSINDEK